MAACLRMRAMLLLLLPLLPLLGHPQTPALRGSKTLVDLRTERGDSCMNPSSSSFQLVAPSHSLRLLGTGTPPLSLRGGGARGGRGVRIGADSSDMDEEGVDNAEVYVCARVCIHACLPHPAYSAHALFAAYHTKGLRTYVKANLPQIALPKLLATYNKIQEHYSF